MHQTNFEAMGHVNCTQGSLRVSESAVSGGCLRVGLKNLHGQLATKIRKMCFMW